MWGDDLVPGRKEDVDECDELLDDELGPLTKAWLEEDRDRAMA